jgi:hypothetical protein
VGSGGRSFHHATGSSFGPINEFLQSTFDDIAHRIRLIGLELHEEEHCMRLAVRGRDARRCLPSGSF